MPNKSYKVIIQIDFNTIDCPGVWLCPKGKAFLKVCLFGIADLTNNVDPFFPLVIRERFIFEKNFRDVSSVYELHDKIGRSVISIELLQCPVGSPGCVKLAIFNSLLSDLLHPYSSCFAKPPDTSGIELLFTTCKIFPGIIAPKADVSLKVVVSDTHGGGSKPTVHRMPLKLRKGDAKRQQAVCHSKNGLNCGCFSRDRAQPREQDQPYSGERGDGAQIEQTVLAGRDAAYRSSTDHRPKTSQFYPRPPPRLTANFHGHQGQYRKSASQKPIQPLLNSKKKSQPTPQDPKYEDEPDMDWAKVNLGVAFGPGEYKGNDNDQNAMFSGGWEYVWDGGDKRSKRQTILSARRPEFRATAEPDDKLEDPMSGREDEYGDEAIRREMEECHKLLKEYKPDDVRNDPELKIKYDNCVKNIDWLSKYGGKSHSSDKLMTSTSLEEPLVTAQREPVVLPCHGKCCKCKEEQVGTGLSLSNEREGQTYRAPQARNRDLLSPIDENSEWFPRKKWEKEQLREVRRQTGKVWERERVIHEQERRSGQNLESGLDGPRLNGQDEQERRRREREWRRQQEIIRQRVQRERMRRQQHDSSSDQERGESIQSGPIGDTDKRSQPSEAPRKEPPKAERRVYSPDIIPKPSTGVAEPLRPSTTPYNGRPQDQGIPGPSTKRKPTPPQQTIKSSNTTKPQTVQQRAQSPNRMSRPDEGDSPGEDCDCDICERYQELYNPSSHPCPRFRKNAKKNNRQTPPKNTGTGARKLVASRKNANGPSKKHDRKTGEQCGFFSCDGPIDIEAIEEMNAIQKFYYGK